MDTFTDMLGRTSCLRCGFVGNQEAFDHHDCPDPVGRAIDKTFVKVDKIKSNVDKEVLRDDFKFLLGMFQGMSYFSDNSEMGNAMEFFDEQLNLLWRKVQEALKYVD